MLMLMLVGLLLSWCASWCACVVLAFVVLRLLVVVLLVARLVRWWQGHCHQSLQAWIVLVVVSVFALPPLASALGWAWAVVGEAEAEAVPGAFGGAGGV